MSTDSAESDSHGRKFLHQKSVRENNIVKRIEHGYVPGGLDVISSSLLIAPVVWFVSFPCGGLGSIVSMDVDMIIGIISLSACIGVSQNPALLLIGGYSAVFTFLSVRQNIRARENEVAPTLFMSARDGELGVVNVGKGTAHQLSVAYSIIQDYDESEFVQTGDDEFELLEENGIVPVDEFTPFIDDDRGSKERFKGKREGTGYEVVAFKFEYKNDFGDRVGPNYRVIERDEFLDVGDPDG